MTRSGLTKRLGIVLLAVVTSLDKRSIVDDDGEGGEETVDKVLEAMATEFRRVDG